MREAGEAAEKVMLLLTSFSYPLTGLVVGRDGLRDAQTSAG